MVFFFSVLFLLMAWHGSFSVKFSGVKSLNEKVQMKKCDVCAYFVVAFTVVITLQFPHRKSSRPVGRIVWRWGPRSPRSQTCLKNFPSSTVGCLTPDTSGSLPSMYPNGQHGCMPSSALPAGWQRSLGHGTCSLLLNTYLKWLAPLKPLLRLLTFWTTHVIQGLWHDNLVWCLVSGHLKRDTCA